MPHLHSDFFPTRLGAQGTPGLCPQTGVILPGVGAHSLALSVLLGAQGPAGKSAAGRRVRPPSGGLCAATERTATRPKASGALGSLDGGGGQ